MDHHRRALALAAEVGDQHVEGHTLSNLGVVHARMGEHDRALEEQQQGLALLRRTGSRGDECEALNDVGHTLRLLGRSIDALQTHERALELARQIGDRYQEARALDGCAAAVQATDPETSRRHWGQALQIFAELEVPEADQVKRRLLRDQSDI
jgi:tetratricopeptide (TPR) repeat protein